MNRPLWPVIIPIKEDELLSSWIIRTSLANGSYPLAWTWFFWGKWRAWGADFDRHCPDDKLQCLVFGQFYYKTLKDATLEPVIEQIIAHQTLSKHQGWPWVTQIGIRNRDRTGGLRCCPDCLNSAVPYFKKEWRFAWVHSCPVHRRLLIEHCPHCFNAITPHRCDMDHPLIYICQRCEFDLRQSESEISHQDALSLQRVLSESLNRCTDMPWGIRDVHELFMNARYLLSFLNVATSGVTFADLALCQYLEIMVKSDGDIEAHSVEKFSSVRLAELSAGVYQLLQMRLVDVARLFKDIGYTQQSMNKSSMEKSSQIVDLISTLPVNSRDYRKPKRHAHLAVGPRLKEEVNQLWKELQIYLH
jgi:hypothetical protein